jgi:competence protein ComEA
MRRTRSILLLTVMLLAACQPSREPANAPVAAAGRDAANRNAAAVNAAPRPPCVNLNQATAAELTQLPGVGEVMGRRIVEYRERHGPFRRPADVIIIEGFSEKKYRAIADLVCAE